MIVENPDIEQLNNEKNAIVELREQLLAERNAMQQQYSEMSNQLNSERAGSDGLKTKIKRLYHNLRGKTNDATGLD